MTKREYKYHRRKKAIKDNPNVEQELFKEVVNMFFDIEFEERFQKALNETFNDALKDKPTKL